jgi:hypothetical protein
MFSEGRSVNYFVLKEIKISLTFRKVEHFVMLPYLTLFLQRIITILIACYHVHVTPHYLVHSILTMHSLIGLPLKGKLY